MKKSGWDMFLKWISFAKNKDELAKLFELLLTAEEKESITTRCLIVDELIKKEKPQREIAATLKVSIAKITRGSNELKRMPQSLIDFLAKHSIN